MREKFLLCAASLIAFGGSLRAPFQFDDFALFQDPVITSPSGWWQCWRLLQTRPLTWFSFWANYQLGGESAWGYHAVNLALHLIAVLLLWDVLQRLLPAGIAFAAATIFAVHPILTEPVGYIFARGTLIAAVFSLLAVRAWMMGRLWVAVGWFTVAMAGKEECVALPVVLLLLPGARKNRGAVAAMFGIALAFGIRAIWATGATSGSGAGSQSGISPLDYLAAQGIAILRYLRLAILPWGFSVDPEISATSGWIALAAWIGVAALVGILLGWRPLRQTRAGWWFLAGLILLLPSSSIFPAADLAADRRMYLPMMAFCASMTILAASGIEALRLPKRIAIAAAALAVALLCAISVRYTIVWMSPRALWTEAILRAPEKTRPRIQLARTLPPEAALEVLDDAQRGNPDDPGVASEQGRNLLVLGRPAEALAAFGRALALAPDDPPAINNRGVALLALGQPEAARSDFERALDKNACLFDARLNLLRLGDSPPPGPGCRYTPQQQSMLSQATHK